MSLLIPFNLASDYLEHFLLNESFLNKLKDHSLEITSLIFLSEKKNDILDLFKVCCEKVVEIHKNDVEDEKPRAIPQCYNLPKFGRVYYFEDHGFQIQRMRTFLIDKNNISNKNFDDTPHNHFSKLYLQVIKKGTLYLLLYFRSIYGHCYGFHVVPGSEGRKDVAAPLYTHLIEGLQTVFYDFT